eukprot:m.237381 g.237381  ORF g.237381 m.237381 type:complete len:389 (-) comp19369_c0_seq4:136-1302(-)
MFACAFGCQATKRIIHSHLAFPRVSMRQFTFPASLWGTGVKILGTIDCHAAGEPARVVISGMPSVAGRTMMEKRIVLMNEMDHFRKLLLQEPRGYPCQNANIIFPSDAAGVQFGYVILEQNKIYPAMSGHNTICVATALLETGMIQMEEPETIFDLESPAGLIRIHAACEHGRVTRVSLDNTPAFVEHLDKEINVPHFGRVRLDVAFGGMWYAVVNASTIGLDLAPENGKEICRIGEMIKVAAKEQLPVSHPEYDYHGPDIIVLRGDAGATSTADARNAVVMSNTTLDWDRPATWTGMIDRSPCGTGTCAVMATMHARGELKVGEDFVHESIIGSQFVGRILAETTVAGKPAIVPRISGRAWITQYCQVVCDPSDPYPEGYTVGDIWG